MDFKTHPINRMKTWFLQVSPKFVSQLSAIKKESLLLTRASLHNIEISSLENSIWLNRWRLCKVIPASKLPNHVDVYLASIYDDGGPASSDTFDMGMKYEINQEKPNTLELMIDINVSSAYQRYFLIYLKRLHFV